MILYHGSYMAIDRPDISFSRENVDFGKGFYTTPIEAQAVSWAARFKRKHGQAVLSVYAFDELLIGSGRITVLDFETYSDAWLDFVMASRTMTCDNSSDLVIGGVANDKVFDTVQLYMDGLIDKDESIKRLRYEKPNVQYCFRTQQVIDQHLKFITSEVLP